MTCPSKWMQRKIAGGLKTCFLCRPLEGADKPTLPWRFFFRLLRPGYFRFSSRVFEEKSWKDHALLSCTKPLMSSVARNPKSVFVLLTAVQTPPSVRVYLDFILPIFCFSFLSPTISVPAYPQFPTLPLTTPCAPGGFPFDPCTAWLSQGEVTKVQKPYFPSLQLLNHCSPEVGSTQCTQNPGRMGFQLGMI